MRKALWGVVIAVAGCGDGKGRDTAAAHDAALQDAAPPDAVSQDATPSDSTPPDSTPPDAGPTGPEVAAGPLRAVADGSTLYVMRGDAVLLRFPADAFQIGLVRAVSDDVFYDPYAVLKGATVGVPRDLRWATPAAVHARGALTLDLDYGDDGHATLDLQPDGDDHLAATFTPDPGHPIVFLRLRARADPTEAFYGLGEYLDDVNHRGHVRAMHFEADPATESRYNEAHVPVPFLIGTRGWGLFVQSDRVGAFALGTEADDVVDVAFAAGPHPEQGLRFHLFGADHPLDLTRHYYDVAGYPGRIARWALGPLVWRNENRDQAQVEDDVRRMRDLDLPASAIWIDRPYASGVNSFDFEPARFPDPAAMIARVHALGFRLALWHSPYVGEHDDATAALAAEAEANHYFPPRVGIIATDWGRPVDFTNPAAYAWWQAHVRQYTDAGVEGFKLDYGEDVVPGAFTIRNHWDFFDGSDERTTQRNYQRLYHRVYGETMPADGGFLLVRSGAWGDQAVGCVVWPGDLDASFARHAEAVDERGDRYDAVGGLPASLVAGLGLGPSGYPFYGSDTGGYRHSPPDKELFVRWFEQTALSTVMQIGDASNDVAWEPTADNGFDAETLDLYRTYTRLHLRLWPYVWTYAQRLAQDGRAIERPYGLARPELGRHPSDTYFLGDHLLVAPVLARGRTTRAVPFPPGRWADWWTGQVLDGGMDRTVDAPLGTLPLYLAEGGIVPLLRPTIDTLAPTTEATVDSYATTPGPLYARVFPGPAPSDFTLFDGARVAQSADGAAVTLTTHDGSEFAHGFVLEVIADAPASVTLDGAPVSAGDRDAVESALSGYAYDAAHRTLVVGVPAGDHRVEVR